MTLPRPGSSDADLERALIGLASDLDFPDAGDMASLVGRRLRSEVPAPRPVGRVLRPAFRPAWQRLAVAAAAVFVLASAILIASPDARRAVAGWLGIRGVRIQSTPTAPAAPVRRLGEGLELGMRQTLARAEARTSFRVVKPTLPGLGEPDAVFVEFSSFGPQVSLVYRSGPGLPRADATGVGLLVTMFRASIDEEVILKKVTTTGHIEAVRVGDGQGFWVEGTHEVVFLDETGDQIPDSLRVSDNALVWERGELSLRIESALSKVESLRIARSIR